MAAMTVGHLFFSPPVLPLSRTHNPKSLFLAPTTHLLRSTCSTGQNRSTCNSITTTITRAGEHDRLGDFGARDPFPEEIASNFGEKVVGNYSTEHNILIPNIAALSISQLECSPISPTQTPISHDEAKQLLRKVVGWRLLNEEGRLKLQCLWKLKDFKSGIELFNRIYNVVESTGHFPSLHLEQPNEVRAELWTSSIGGLSMNDFIVAAKIDDIRTSDLIPKKRAWA